MALSWNTNVFPVFDGSGGANDPNCQGPFYANGFVYFIGYDIFAKAFTVRRSSDGENWTSIASFNIGVSFGFANNGLFSIDSFKNATSNYAVVLAYTGGTAVDTDGNQYFL